MRPPVRIPRIGPSTRYTRCCSSSAACSSSAHSASPSPSPHAHASNSGSSSSPSTSTSGPRLRFAPSPTGHLHLGGLRTALFNHLVARHGKGKWVLRIEDTDRTRLVPGAVDSLRNSLEWAGLDYDEGIGAGGSYGPYVQSERLEIYNHHINQLLENGHAYECFCSPDELQAIKKSLSASGSRMSYDGRCRHLSDEERVRKRKAGEKFVVRFKDPGGIPNMPHDLVFGDLRPHTDTGHENADDFILIKQDGYPTYHFANIVDDHLMEITHVLRGEEWIPSLPKHLGLYRAFGWSPPQFGHLPLLLNEKGMKLSKRTGDVTVDSYKAKGYEPEALVNFIALLGWDYTAHITSQTDDRLPANIRTDNHSLYEVYTMPQLIEAFDLRHLSRRKASVNHDKLDFLNKMMLRSKAGRLGVDGDVVGLGKGEERWGERTREELVSRYQEELRAARHVLKESPLVEDRDYIEMVFDTELPRVVKLNELAPTSTYFFVDPDYSSPDTTAFFNSLKKENYTRVIETVIEILQDATGSRPYTTDMGWDAAKEVVSVLKLRARSEVMLPMRHALTGQKKGPSVPEIINVIGISRALKRLRSAVEYAERVGK